MKYFLLAVISAFMFSIIRLYNEETSFLINWLGILLVLLGVIFFAVRFYKFNRIFFLILQKTRALSKQVSKNEKIIDNLKTKIFDLQHRLSILHEVNEDVKEVVEANLSLWREQLDLHTRIISLCNKRIYTLSKNYEELKLLVHLKRQIKKEPDAEKKLSKLEPLIKKIDGSVSLKIKNELEYLIRDMRTDTRHNKIHQLKERLNVLEKRVG